MSFIPTLQFIDCDLFFPNTVLKCLAVSWGLLSLQCEILFEFKNFPRKNCFFFIKPFPITPMATHSLV